MELSVTLIIIIVTTLVSIGGFSSPKIIEDLIFYPPAVTQQKQWWRFLTCGLIHADFGHLILNMYALYIFGVRDLWSVWKSYLPAHVHFSAGRVPSTNV